MPRGVYRHPWERRRRLKREWIGTNAAAIQKSGTDSGSGSDASTLAARYTASDTGTDSESTRSYRAASDTGSGTEKVTDRKIVVTDTGAGADASTLRAAHSRSDTGSGVESRDLRMLLGFNGKVQILGCSNDRMIFEAYEALSTRDIAINSAGDGQTLQQWAAEGVPWAGGTAGHDTIPGFDANYATYGASIVWWPVCIKAGDYATNADAYTAFQAFVALLRLRTPAPLYVSDGIGTQPSATCNNPTQQRYVVEQAIINGLAFRGPGFPAASAPEPDNCHFDPATSTNIQQRAVDFLDGDGSILLVFARDTGTDSESTRSYRRGTDSGSGSEASTLHASITASDTGTGADAVGTRTLTRTDTGVGSEASTEHATYTASDTGTDSEATGTRKLVLTDTGTGADSVASRVFTASDSGAGADASSLHAATTATDTGSGADAATLSIPVSTSDTGSAADVSSLHAALSPSQTGSGADQSSSTATASASDTGTGSDRVTSRAAVITESGSGADASSEHASYALTESGTSDETGTAVPGVTHVADTGTGADAATLTVVLSSTDTNDATTELATVTTHDFFYVSDTNGEAEAATLAASYTRTESGSSTEAGTPRVVLARTESGSGADASSESAPYSRTDTGTGADASSLHVAHARSDTGTGAEQALSYRRATDTGSGADAKTLAARFSGAESGLAAEASAETAALSRTESGAAVDRLGERTFDVRDTGSGSDLSSANTENEKSGIDPADADDTSTLRARYTRTDSGAGSDAASLSVRTNRGESGSGSDVKGDQGRSVRQPGTGTEQKTLRALIAVADAGVAADNALVRVRWELTDQAVGTDEITALNIAWVLTDPFSALEQASLTALAGDDDGGAGNDVLGNPATGTLVAHEGWGTLVPRVLTGAVEKAVVPG